MDRWTLNDSGICRAPVWLAFLGALGILAGARAQEPPPPASDAPGDSSQVQSRKRPSFMLPDIVVEGEDLSRLTGGMRLLEIEMPGLRPEQRPLVVAPGETRYARRFARPFATALPPVQPRLHPRGLLALTAEEGYGGGLSFATLGAETHMLWGDLNGWSERVKDRDQLEVALGWVRARPAANPSTRFSLGLDYALDRARERPLADTTGLGSQNPMVATEQKLLMGGLLWEGLMRAGEGRFVWRARAHAGEFRTAWEPHLQRTEHPVGRWIRGSFGIATFGTRRDLIALWPQESAPMRPEVDLDVGWSLRQGAADSTRQGPHWQGHLGWSRLWPGTRIGIGAGSGGDRDEQVIGPWVAVEHRAADGKLRVRLESEPRALFAEDLLAGGARLHPGGSDSPGRVSAVWERALIDQRGTLRDHLPGEMERALPLPVPARFDPLIAPQTTLAHVAGELLLLMERAYLRLRTRTARWEHPFGWEACELSQGPAGYLLANMDEPRWRTDIDAQLRVRFARSFECVLTHAWHHDDAPTPEDAILFLPEHEASVLVGGRTQHWLYGMRLRYRQSAPDAAGEEIGESLSWSAALGWSFGTMRAVLVAENLLGEEITILPGVGLDERRVRVFWERTFFGRAS